MSSASAQIEMDKELRTLLATDRAWANAANENRMEELWSYWNEDAMILRDGMSNLTGRDAIREFTIQMRKDPNFSIQWNVVGGKISPGGTWGYTFGEGIVTRTGHDGNPLEIVRKYLVVWEKADDGKWKCVIEN